MDKIKTQTWHTIHYLGMPASRVKFVQVEREFKEPDEATKVRKSTWSEKLNERKAILEEANPESRYLIKFDEETGEDALFEKNEPDKKKMWAGTTVTFAGIDANDLGASVKVHPISYTEWIACYNPAYSEVFIQKGLSLPHAGIGVSVIMETTDGLIPLTRRGIETPVYPAMLYSPGGGPKPGEGSTEALLQEILEETGLKAGEHFNPNELFMMALIADSRFVGSSHSRPELVARLTVNVTYLQMEKIQQEHVKTKGLKETDVWGLEPVSTYPASLQQVIKLHGREMCPPTEAALTYEFFELRKREIGEAAYEELIEFIQIVGGYEREEFVPPIKRLAG